MIDFDKLVLAPCQAVFGEPATFNPVASAPGAPSFAGRGIYTERPVDVQLADGSVLSSAEKWLDIRLSEFATTPAQGDRVDLRGETGETNLIRMLTRNPASVAVVENLPEVIGELSGRLQLEALEAGDDEVLRGLLAELDEAAARYPHRAPPGPRSPLTPVILKAADGPLTFLTTIAQFGASQDVTVRDLRLELLFPADEQTCAAMAALAQTLSG